MTIIKERVDKSVCCHLTDERKLYAVTVICHQVPEHDSHCNLCGFGQYDLGNPDVPRDKQDDNLSYCGECGADICAECNCGHDAWGA